MGIITFEKDIPGYLRKHGYELLVNMRKSGNMTRSDETAARCAKRWWGNTASENSIKGIPELKQHISLLFKQNTAGWQRSERAAEALLAAIKAQPDVSVYTLIGQWYDAHKGQMPNGCVRKNTLKQIFEMAIAMRETAPIIDITVQNSLLEKLNAFRAANPGHAGHQYRPTLYVIEQTDAAREQFFEHQKMHKQFMSQLTDAEHVVLKKLEQVHNWTRPREGAAKLQNAVIAALYDAEHEMNSWRPEDYLQPSSAHEQFMVEKCQHYSTAILQIKGLNCLVNQSRYGGDKIVPESSLLCEALNHILTTGEDIDRYAQGSIELEPAVFLSIAAGLDEPYRSELCGGINLFNQNKMLNVLQTVKLFCRKEPTPEAADVTGLLDNLTIGGS